MSEYAQTLYRYACVYLERAGWRREEPESGWWWHDEETAMHLIGEAVDIQLQRDGIDTRIEP